MSDVPAASVALHTPGTQVFRELVMAVFPVVHWHLVSVRPHPEPVMAVKKQGTCESGCC